MNQQIGILDYGMGNINSVTNALNYLGYEPMLVTTAAEIESCTHVIVPGVGSYAQAMTNMHASSMHTALINHAYAGKPLLGICLGMQILSDQGEEGGKIAGLGLIPGTVKLLDTGGLPVPHVGWNSLQFHYDHPITAKLKKHVDFYFVHSYYFNAHESDNVLASAHYGKQFPALVTQNNIVGIQFHPEKSQDNGLLLLENFCEWDGQC